ncbi:hypothetical protein [Streptomyces cucumeris]|uniref:hypothetical protein n=1 Tax=Streptomyces cucumeris TaxID=2962890 RepID=UPI0020C894DC|nr:hypothetical protein [Streptomyces sp. NEAU-Y11]MCP9209629.1 hypothetical protein [Streptomyces sp. NEAU-Y11]
MSAPPGSRIVAVRNSDDATVYVYGRGVYAGHFPRPGSGNWTPADYERAQNAILANESRMDDSWLSAHWDKRVSEGKATREEADIRVMEGLASLAREHAKPLEQRARELLAQMDLNPRLDLDNGSTVWGCQCWWMPEGMFAEFTGGRTVVEVAPPQEEGGS